MLIDFTVTNYSSILSGTTLSAETGERLSRLKQSNTIIENNSSLLKSLIIVGPNGSGKSNLLSGLQLMRGMVLSNPGKVTDALPYNPFLLNETTPQEPTEFSVKFNYSSRTYEYSFAYTNQEIVNESLQIINKTSVSTYFSRDHQKYSVIPDNLKGLADATKQNSLFLYNAQQMNDQYAIDVIKWFQDDLIFVDNTGIPDKLGKLMDNPKVKKEFLNFLHFADFNIIDVKVREVPIPKIPDQFVQLIKSLDATLELPTTSLQLYALHKRYNADGNVIGNQEIPLSRESRGTQKVFMIALSIINAQLNGDGKTLLFDEFDDSLHFELSKALLQIFNSKTNKNQFILTTHELQLLDTNLRTDQIYLMEKDFKGRSELKSIFDFKDSRKNARADVKFLKKYIEGRFGALPEIQVDEMLTALNSVGGEGDVKKV
ncbi:AAA family ATPase [Lentilactobacillus sunkii]|uniref:AAA+ ATPase domain-containing protein n=1 Tax=Lentilactobacillus sunkii DSM 19904 TaxID=1423808 RepID=A0A0R1KZA0_9LACO|nr:AAA family ATPase [Lentilactobacillus sunkii]KRK88632.1 hypothetical protein FD17_GL002323 [Lentilactobacillus sunkii DSM 19904]